MINIEKFRLLIFDEIDSTNNEAKRLLSRGEGGNFAIIAKNQTAGRGRYGREWKSADGNLYLSLVIPSGNFIEKQHELSFVSAISVHKVLGSIYPNLYIKWPNDILAGRAKIAGILLESVKYFGAYYLIIGIGVNIASAPVIDGRDVTSLAELDKSIKILPGEMADLIISNFSHYLNLWDNNGFVEIRKLWLAKSFAPGTIISVSDGKEAISGAFVDIDETGAIMLKADDGEVHKLSVGEVFFGSGNE